MTFRRYPSLFVAALVATFIGAAAAQTQSDDPSRLPANKGTSQADQTQPAQQPTDKMKGQDQNMAQNQSGQMGTASQKNPDQASPTKDKTAKSDHSAMSSGQHAMSGHKSKSGKDMSSEESDTQHQAMNHHPHTGKSKRQSAEEAASPDEKAYREALRDCAKQQDTTQRGSCLDSAIERFHRNV